MIGWLDCGAGVSGDMLLGALVDAGVPLEVLQQAVDAVLPGAVQLSAEPVRRGGLAALRLHVRVAGAPAQEAADPVDVAGPVDVTGPAAGGGAHRTWRDVRALLEQAPLDDRVRRTALTAFGLLAQAEAQVHGVAVDDVHFHEVGALDAVADVVGAAAGLAALGLDRLTASEVSVGSGTARTAHGALPVPAPAVLALLAGAPVQAGPAAHEATTPTGAALLRATVAGFGPLPAMTPVRVGIGAGGRNRDEAPNALRLVLGDPRGSAEQTGALVVEANVDDLDPRVWPHVLEALLRAGAHDAWLTPVLMKKGRPAHVLSALCPPAAAEAVREVVLTETSTIGLRSYPVDRTVLDRDERTVDVEGRPVRVKTARRGGRVVNVMPEWDDVAAAAAALGRPVKAVLAAAHAAALER